MSISFRKSEHHVTGSHSPYSWKFPSILLIASGIAYTGDWVFLIALNLTMLNLSGAALAIAGLYMLKPFAALCTNGWSGSMIDRTNKRRMMISLDLTRAILIGILPLLHNVWMIYAVVLVVYMSSSMFRPTVMAYIVHLVPEVRLKRFNSIQSLINSGAFLIGPAIAGVLFLVMSPQSTIIVTAIGFLISALLTLWLPDLEPKLGKSRRSSMSEATSGAVTDADSTSVGSDSAPVDSDSATPDAKPESIRRARSPWTILREDWGQVYQFSHEVPKVMMIYLLFYLIMVLTAALDAQEVALTKQVLQVTDSQYSYLVSIAGAGLGVGALVNLLVVKRLHIRTLIGAGSIGVGIGYMMYAFGASFSMVALGFFVLAFFLAFANTGFTTFYQQHVPVHMMGRISGVYGLIIAVVQMVCVFVIGTLAQVWDIAGAVRLGAVGMLLVAIMLAIYTARSLNKINA
ncbi:MFS transporter [Paenibacillus kandeliae]|uniref:MFS transporter n=1 Tax=Paenibacillus kandeliae TaxID=3231269 RepID=UPI0034599A24